jgi:hypothetical protein
MTGLIKLGIVLVLAAAGTVPHLALSDHIYPRNLSANGPWKTNLQYITGRAQGDLPVTDRNRKMVIDQAGVPALIDMDGVLRAYFQWAPTKDDTIQYFDHIGFSTLENGRWSSPQIINIDFDRRRAHTYPFDPTVVALPQGGYRLYFTQNESRRAGPSNKMTLGSAYSEDGVNFAIEPGHRLKLDDRRINDCAVIYFDGKWHLISPNHDKMGEGYYATSEDGLTFERQDDLFMSGGAWLGNMVEHRGAVYFFGTGFTLKTKDFKRWERVQRNRMADPAVAISNGKLHVLSVGM